jgi:hypothetical protein
VPLGSPRPEEAADRVVATAADGHCASAVRTWQSFRNSHASNVGRAWDSGRPTGQRERAR